MKSREEYNAYMKAYQQNKRDNMTFEEWREFRDKNNAYKRKKYGERTPEEIEKHREYQRNKQKILLLSKKTKQMNYNDLPEEKREKLKEYQRQYQKNRRENMTEEDKEKRREYLRNYRELNRDKINTYANVWKHNLSGEKAEKKSNGKSNIIKITKKR